MILNFKMQPFRFDALVHNGIKNKGVIRAGRKGKAQHVVLIGTGL